MMRKIMSGLAAAALTASLATICWGAEYQHSLDIEKMNFSWSVEGETLAAKISAPTSGWVAIGFNPSSKMKDADIVIGYVKDGNVKISDEYGIGATQHQTDDKIGGTDNVTVVGGSEENGVTTLEFVIPLNSGDAKDRAIDPAADTVVIVAYGGDRDSFKMKHVFRDTLTVNLANGARK